ncbi:hypothetical protein [Cupriavidus oxalaticus]|uniref:Transmembrane protein n=1 Tax=Cupriavidus oxalaticus TaxID=96344 RepID=A0A375GF39_9BURK|nr:hypothetical protein [Cupriavidus oxalaticus]QRQ86248.1 hypothetical protein JTE91_23865 [Cupriavidus oxalaticus]QRQ95425.1 hypothetical protein JTE92_18395 [Cupriavidus oxalaticus]WQD84082.1 hypothetical protein U0036_06105 [Cupriavidus oxalaticus]SPC17396.1 putative transmembrane protein [Cupriavidus oxalaticus]
MSITLAVGATTVTLSSALYWSDENNWAPVEQTAERTITGAMIISAAQRIGGRPITLEPADDESGWMRRDVIDQLRNWAAVAGQQMTLTLCGQERTVIWRHQDGGFEANPVVHYDDVVDTDNYLATLRLMEI